MYFGKGTEAARAEVFEEREVERGEVTRGHQESCGLFLEREGSEL